MVLILVLPSGILQAQSPENQKAIPIDGPGYFKNSCSINTALGIVMLFPVGSGMPV